jgi:hypothetical protein
MGNNPKFEYGFWIEVKIWVSGASDPSDNIHIKLPKPASLPCSQATIKSPVGAKVSATAPQIQNTAISWEPASCYMIVQVLQGNALKAELNPVQSGTINTQSLGLKGLTEIKILMVGAGEPSDIVFVNLP